MLGVVSVEASQQHLVALSLCLSFRQLVVVVLDEGMDVVYVAIFVVAYLKQRTREKEKHRERYREKKKQITKC